MQPDERDAALLFDALSAARELQGFMKGVDRDRFLRERALQLIAERELTVIGEAISRLSEQFCATQGQIEWRKVRGLRNVVIHDYGKVDLDIIWNVVSTELPRLIVFLQTILPEPPKGCFLLAERDLQTNSCDSPDLPRYESHFEQPNVVGRFPVVVR